MVSRARVSLQGLDLGLPGWQGFGLGLDGRFSL
jgi:hypothetical protein